MRLVLFLSFAAVLNAQQLSKEYIYFGDRLLAVKAGSSSPPAAVSVTPSSGSGTTQTFTYVFSDPDGVADLVSAQIAINSALGGVNTCYLAFGHAANQLFILNDAGTVWLGPISLGTSATLGNSQCSVAGISSSFSTTATNLTVNLRVTFGSGFTGTKNQYMYAQDAGGLSDGFHIRGTWTIGTSAAPAAVSVTPSSGSGLTQTFTYLYSDASGVNDLVSAQIAINSALGGVNTCYLAFGHAANQLFLFNDAGTAWLGPIALGTSATLGNSQCSVAGITSSFSTTATNLTLNLRITFSSGFSGAKNQFMFAQDSGGLTDGWHIRGTWTVP